MGRRSLKTDVKCHLTICKERSASISRGLPIICIMTLHASCILHHATPILMSIPETNRRNAYIPSTQPRTCLQSTLSPARNSSLLLLVKWPLRSNDISHGQVDLCKIEPSLTSTSAREPAATKPTLTGKKASASPSHLNSRDPVGFSESIVSIVQTNAFRSARQSPSPVTDGRELGLYCQYVI
jgi:hypothetical protein